MELHYVTGAIDVTAHSTSVFQENELLTNIIEMFIPKSNISIAEPIDVQIDELGSNAIQMYQFIGDMIQKLVFRIIVKLYEESYIGKDEPAINEHHDHIIKNNTKKHITYTI